MLSSLVSAVFGLFLTVLRIFTLKFLFAVLIAPAFGLPAVSLLTVAALYLFVNGLVASTKYGFVQLILDSSYASQVATPESVKASIAYGQVSPNARKAIFGLLQLVSILAILAFAYFAG